MESTLAWTRKKDSKDRRESESNWQVGEKITILVSGVSLGLMLDAEPMFLKVIEWRRMVMYSLIISCNSKFQALVKNSFKIEKKDIDNVLAFVIIATQRLIIKFIFMQKMSR